MNLYKASLRVGETMGHPLFNNRDEAIKYCREKAFQCARMRKECGINWCIDISGMQADENGRFRETRTVAQWNRNGENFFND